MDGRRDPGYGLRRHVLAAGVSAALAVAVAATWQPHVAGDRRRQSAGSSQRFTIALTAADYERLFEQRFEVLAGTRRVEVAYSVTGSDARTVVDLGLRGPHGLRGWSGGSQSAVWVSALGASPGYLPGAIEPGTWAAIVGVPNIRAGRTDTLEIAVRLFADDLPEPVALPGRGGGWYVGDLHAHSGHSDGRIRSRRGARVGTPPHRVFDDAVTAGLDFLALTDHNTASHWLDVDRLQPYYDDLLLLHAREITTYRGHANAVGERTFHDFRPAGPEASPAPVLQPVAAGGAFLSINHPSLPDGEICMGCGWNVTSAQVLAAVHGVEVVNGDVAAGPLAGWTFWAELLTRGHRLTAVGGSDEHSVDDPTDRRLGRPATVVWARALSESAIVAGLKSGRAYVRVRGPDGPVLDGFTAERGDASAEMGEALPAAAGPVRLTATLRGAAGQTVEWIVDGEVAGRATVGDAPLRFEVITAQASWGALVVRDAAGPTLMSNAIYLAPRRP